MSLWTRTMTAINAAWSAFKDPGSQLRDMTQEARIDYYSRAWGYYRSTMWGSGYNWTYELARRELYKHTRLIYNPVPQIVDFYVDNIWQPAVDETYESLVTPLTDQTDKNIIAAVAQLDQWSHFLTTGQKIKRYCAATGNVLVEGIDDPIRGKILDKAIWAGFVTKIELNDTGDVQAYTLEYPVYDPQAKKTFQYRKEVTKERISYFRDDKPFSPDGIKPEVEENIYGFCFAVWIRHTDEGSDYGPPACPSFDKVDNVNSLASHVDDFIHKAIESPKIIATGGGTNGNGDVLPIIGATRRADGTIADQDPRLNWMVLKTTAGASVHDLLGTLDLTAVSPELDRQIKSFENDYPELQATSIIRENSQLSGAALERMLGPAQNRLDGVQANYNQQLIKLRQMGIAVGGMRARNGWAPLTEQQRVFLPFNLDSYSKGDLNFSLKRSVLVQTTEAEDEELRMAKLKRIAAESELVDMGHASLESFLELRAKEKQLPVDVDAAAELARIKADEKESIETAPVLNALRMPPQLTTGAENGTQATN